MVLPGPIIIPMLVVQEETVTSQQKFENHEEIGTASILDGYSLEDEKKFKIEVANMIQDLGSQVDPQNEENKNNAIDMAAVLFHQFSTQCFYKNYQSDTVAAACLFVVLGAEMFDEIARVLYHHKKPYGEEPTPSQHYNFNKDFERTSVEVLEFVSTLDCKMDSWIADTDIELPYSYLSKLNEGLEGDEAPRMELRKTAVAITRLTLLFTNWSIRYPASTIACAVLNIAALFSELILHDFIPKRWPERWWTLIDSTTSMAIISEMTEEFMKDCRVNWEVYATMTQQIDPSVTLKLPALNSRPVKVDKPKMTPKKTQGPENKETKKIIRKEQKENKPHNKMRYDLTEKINTSSFAPQKASRMGLKLREPNAANDRPAVLGEPLEDPKRDPPVTLQPLTSRIVKVKKPKGIENKKPSKPIKQGIKEYKPRNKVRHDLIEKISLSSFVTQKASRMGLKLRETNAANKRPALQEEPHDNPKRSRLSSSSSIEDFQEAPQEDPKRDNKMSPPQEEPFKYSKRRLSSASSIDDFQTVPQKDPKRDNKMSSLKEGPFKYSNRRLSSVSSIEDFQKAPQEDPKRDNKMSSPQEEPFKYSMRRLSSASSIEGFQETPQEDPKRDNKMSSPQEEPFKYSMRRLSSASSIEGFQETPQEDPKHDNKMSSPQEEPFKYSKRRLSSASSIEDFQDAPQEDPKHDNKMSSLKERPFNYSKRRLSSASSIDDFS